MMVQNIVMINSDETEHDVGMILLKTQPFCELTIDMQAQRFE